jgi:hemerythrin
LGDYSERIEKVEKGGSSLAELQALAKELASYAIYWLSHHILLVDKKYTHYFQEHGIQ